LAAKILTPQTFFKFLQLNFILNYNVQEVKKVTF